MLTLQEKVDWVFYDYLRFYANQGKFIHKFSEDENNFSRNYGSNLFNSQVATLWVVITIAYSKSMCRFGIYHANKLNYMKKNGLCRVKENSAWFYPVASRFCSPL